MYGYVSGIQHKIENGREDDSQNYTRDDRGSVGNREKYCGDGS